MWVWGLTVREYYGKWCMLEDGMVNRILKDNKVKDYVMKDSMAQFANGHDDFMWTKGRVSL